MARAVRRPFQLRDELPARPASPAESLNPDIEPERSITSATFDRPRRVAPGTSISVQIDRDEHRQLWPTAPRNGCESRAAILMEAVLRGRRLIWHEPPVGGLPRLAVGRGMPTHEGDEREDSRRRPRNRAVRFMGQLSRVGFHP